MKDQRRPTHYLNFSLLLLLLSLTIGTGLFNYFPGYDNYLLVILGLVCLVPGLLAWFKGSLDIFEPVYSMAISTFMYFCLQVVFVRYDEAFNLRGLDYQSEIPKITILAMLALLGFYVGYYRPIRPSEQSSEKTELDQNELAEMHRYAKLIFGLFFALVVLWIVIGRIPLWTLWIFGEADYGAPFQYGTGPMIGYLFGARNSLPACILLLLATVPSRRWSPIYLLILVAVTIFTMGLGGRWLLFLTLGSVWILFHLKDNKRPSARQLALIGSVALLLTGYVGYYRGRDRALGQDDLDWKAMRQAVVYSSHQIVPSAVYVRWIPDRIPYDWGVPYLAILTQPIPRFLWPDKDVFFARLFGQPRTASESLESVLPRGGTARLLWVSLYTSFGPLGVTLGMALFGWLSHNVYAAYQRRPHFLLPQIYLALFWFFLFLAYGRGNARQIMVGTVTVFAPVWIFHWLVSQRYRVPNQAASKFSLTSPSILASCRKEE